jgi:hypothetical protein
MRKLHINKPAQEGYRANSCFPINPSRGAVCDLVSNRFPDEKIRSPRHYAIEAFYLEIPSFWRGMRSTAAANLQPAGRMRTQPQQFTFPLSGPVRVALLEEGFRTDANVRTCSPDDMAWLHSYAPEALVVPLDLALSLADRKRRGILELPSVRTAIVVLTSGEDSPLTDDYRDLLWRAWGVPIFEQLRGPDGTIIASECEVHDGLHLLTAQDPLPRAWTELEIVRGVCECGAETPRLRRSTSSSTESVPSRRRQARA